MHPDPPPTSTIWRSSAIALNIFIFSPAHASRPPPPGRKVVPRRHSRSRSSSRFAMTIETRAASLFHRRDNAFFIHEDILTHFGLSLASDMVGYNNCREAGQIKMTNTTKERSRETTPFFKRMGQFFIACCVMFPSFDQEQIPRLNFLASRS